MSAKKVEKIKNFEKNSYNFLFNRSTASLIC